MDDLRLQPRRHAGDGRVGSVTSGVARVLDVCASDVAVLGLVPGVLGMPAIPPRTFREAGRNQDEDSSRTPCFSSASS